MAKGHNTQKAEAQLFGSNGPSHHQQQQRRWQRGSNIHMKMEHKCIMYGFGAIHTRPPSIFVYIKCSAACVVHAGLMIRRWPVLYSISQCSPLEQPHRHVLQRNGKYPFNVYEWMCSPFVRLHFFFPILDSFGRCVGTWIVDTDGWHRIRC